MTGYTHKMKAEKNNKKYKEFQSDASNIKFNSNKTQYLYMHLNTVKNVEINKRLILRGNI